MLSVLKAVLEMKPSTKSRSSIVKRGACGHGHTVVPLRQGHNKASTTAKRRMHLDDSSVPHLYLIPTKQHQTVHQLHPCQSRPDLKYRPNRSLDHVLVGQGPHDANMQPTLARRAGYGHISEPILVLRLATVLMRHSDARRPGAIEIQQYDRASTR
jgi:hypothetical protein